MNVKCLLIVDDDRALSVATLPSNMLREYPMPKLSPNNAQLWCLVSVKIGLVDLV